MSEIMEEIRCEELFDVYREEEIAWLEEVEEINKELLELC